MAVQKNFIIRNGLEVNNNLLVADSATDYVGIGTSSPKYTLEVIGGIGVTYANILGIATVGQEFNVGTGGTVITSLDSGLTGFGTATPAYIVDIRSPVSTGQTALYVQGDVRVTGDVYADDISLDQATFNNIEVSGVGTIRTASIDLGYVKTGIVTNLSTSGIGSITIAAIRDGYINTGIVTNLVTTGIASINTGVVTTAYVNTGIITTLSGSNLSYSGIGSFGSINADTGRINTGIVTNLVTTGIASVNTGVLTSAYVTTGIVTTISGTTLNYTGIGTVANFNATNATVSGLTTTGSLAVATGFDVYAADSTFHGSVTIDGNLSIGGTSAILNAVQVRVEDKDIILGFTTAITPSDDTANHGGVAIASTEGYPLVSFAVAGINTLPDTYKQVMWVKRNTMGSGTTDAFLFNYAVGVGSTQVPNGVRFAVGSIQFTDNVINTTNLNTAGVGTITTASVNLGYVNTGIVTTLSGSNLSYTGIGSFGSINADTGRVTTGIVTNLSGSNLNYSGISTLGSVIIYSGIVTATSGIVTYYGDGSKLTGVISGVGINTAGGIVGTGATILDFRGAGISTVTVSAGIATINITGGGGGNIQDGSVTPVKLSTGGPNWNTGGDVTITGTGTTALLVNGNARVTGILTVGTGSITLNGSTDRITVGSGLTLSSSGILAGVVTATSFVGNVTGNATGLSGTPNLNVGIVTATTELDVGIGGTVLTAFSSTGRIGLGTATPASKLDLFGGSTQSIITVSSSNVDCSLGNYFTDTINGSTTYTVSNVPSNRAYSFTLEVNHTSGTITWFSGVEWPGGTPPTLTTGKTHLFMFITDNNGSRWRASSLINYTT